MTLSKERPSLEITSAYFSLAEFSRPRKALIRLRLPDELAQKNYLLTSVNRVLSENANYTRILEQARLPGNSTLEFAERSRLFRTRGLSSDTSFLPNSAIEQTLKAMLSQNLVAAKTIRRVAVVGPGLDFTDKQEGFDFYPPQSIQPFAIIDTLLRLGLAQVGSLQVTTFDLSPRVNYHLARAVQRAKQGHGYVVQLPRDPGVPWKAESTTYWKHFGDHVGRQVAAVPVPAAEGELEVRAVRIDPAIVLRVWPTDLNIVLQRLDLPSKGEFDLIIATNILVYYDLFEQTLAVVNIEHMLKPRSFLLSNNALVEFPFSSMRSVGYLTAVYSSRPNDGDHIVGIRRRVTRESAIAKGSFKDYSEDRSQWEQSFGDLFGEYLRVKNIGKPRIFS